MKATSNENRMTKQEMLCMVVEMRENREYYKMQLQCIEAEIETLENQMYGRR